MAPSRRTHSPSTYFSISAFQPVSTSVCFMEGGCVVLSGTLRTGASEAGTPCEEGMLDGKSGGERRRMNGDGFEAGREKVAVVTAAGSSMGAACARELAERGYRVALVSPSGKAEDLAGELGGFGLAGSVTESG